MGVLVQYRLAKNKRQLFSTVVEMKIFAANGLFLREQMGIYLAIGQIQRAGVIAEPSKNQLCQPTEPLALIKVNFYLLEFGVSFISERNEETVMQRKIMEYYTYFLPIPVCCLMFYLWLEKTNHDYRMSALVMLLPILYGYIVPGIGINLLKLWRFKGKMRMGGYYIHHGFMYAAHMTVCLYFSFGDISSLSPLLPSQMISIVVCSSVINAYVLWLHDIYLVKAGLVEIDSPPAKEGKSPEEIVFYYAPKGFFLLGMTYGMGAVLGYQRFIVEKRASTASFIWVLTMGFSLMFIIPTVYYLVINRNELKQKLKVLIQK